MHDCISTAPTEQASFYGVNHHRVISTHYTDELPSRSYIALTVYQRLLEPRLDELFLRKASDGKPVYVLLDDDPVIL